MIIIDAVGNIITGDHSYFLGIGVASAVRYGLYMFKHVEKVFAKEEDIEKKE